MKLSDSIEQYQTCHNPISILIIGKIGKCGIFEAHLENNDTNKIALTQTINNRKNGVMK